MMHEGQMAIYGLVALQNYTDRSIAEVHWIFGHPTLPYIAIWPEITWTILLYHTFNIKYSLDNLFGRKAKTYRISYIMMSCCQSESEAVHKNS